MPGATTGADTTTMASTSAVTDLSMKTSSRNTIKPLRLRSACNECHSAKVRCSSEKEGCARCRNYGLKCEFQVSLVGRATSKRRKSPQAQQHQKHQQVAHIQPAPSSSSHELTKSPMSIGNDIMTVPSREHTHRHPSAPRHGNGLGNNAEAITSNIPQDFRFHIFGGPFTSMPSRHNSLADTTTTPTDFSLPNSALDYGGHNATEYTEGSSHPHGWISEEQLSGLFSSPATLLTLPTPPQELLAPSKGAGSPELYRDNSITGDYPHTAALVAIVGTLESYVQQNMITIDQIVLLNRRAMTQLPYIMDMAEFKTCQSCPALVATVLDLVVCLYDIAINPTQLLVDQEDHHMQNKHTDFASANVQAVSPQESIQSGSVPQDDLSVSERRIARNKPNFSFGCLELEPEEQDMLRNQILKRDLRKCITTIQSCHQDSQRRQSTGATVGSQQHGYNLKKSLVSSSDRLQERWYKELEHKVGELLASVLAKDL